jgi:hypothetical protein
MRVHWSYDSCMAGAAGSVSESGNGERSDAAFLSRRRWRCAASLDRSGSRGLNASLYGVAVYLAPSEHGCGKRLKLCNRVAAGFAFLLYSERGKSSPLIYRMFAPTQRKTQLSIALRSFVAQKASRPVARVTPSLARRRLKCRPRPRDGLCEPVSLRSMSPVRPTSRRRQSRPRK